MDRTIAIERLPEALRDAVRLADEGKTLDKIALELGIEPEGAPVLLRLALSKLERLLASDAGD